MTFRFSMRLTWRLIWSVLMTIWKSTTGKMPGLQVWDVSVAIKNLHRLSQVATKCSCVFSLTTQCRREALRLHMKMVGNTAPHLKNVTLFNHWFVFCCKRKKLFFPSLLWVPLFDPLILWSWIPRMWRKPKSRGQDKRSVFSCSVWRQQLPQWLWLSVGGHSRKGLWSGDYLPSVWDRGGGRLRVWLRGAVWWSRHQVPKAGAILWIWGRTKNILCLCL